MVLNARILASGCPLWDTNCRVLPVGCLLQDAHCGVLYSRYTHCGMLTPGCPLWCAYSGTHCRDPYRRGTHCGGLTTRVLLQGVYYRAFSAGLLTATCYCEVLTVGVLTAGCLLQGAYCRGAYSRGACCRVLTIGHLQTKHGVEKEVQEPDVE